MDPGYLFSPGKVFHFSGGRSSAYMVIHNYSPGDLVIFCDTGREHEKTYKFLNDFEAFEGIPIIRLGGPGDWEKMLNTGKMIPNRFKRRCTIELKILRARRYLRSIGLFSYIQCVGFRYDEPDRIRDYKQHWQRVKTIFPLHRERVAKPQILEYFRGKPYDLECPEILGNCDLCFLKGEAALMAIIQNEPWRADRWIADEERDPNGYTYLKGKTMRQIRDNALALNKKFDLAGLPRAFNCSCNA